MSSSGILWLYFAWYDKDYLKFYHFKTRNRFHWNGSIWWLVRGTLLMESALFCDFFGNFFHARWKILFSCGGEHARCVWNEHWKTRNSEKLKSSFLGGGEHWWVWQGVGVTWGGLHEVGFARWITRGTSHLVKCFTPWYFYIKYQTCANCSWLFN